MLGGPDIAEARHARELRADTRLGCFLSPRRVAAPAWGIWGCPGARRAPDTVDPLLVRSRGSVGDSADSICVRRPPRRVLIVL